MLFCRTQNIPIYNHFVFFFGSYSVRSFAFFRSYSFPISWPSLFLNRCGLYILCMDGLRHFPVYFCLHYLMCATRAFVFSCTQCFFCVRGFFFHRLLDSRYDIQPIFTHFTSRTFDLTSFFSRFAFMPLNFQLRIGISICVLPFLCTFYLVCSQLALRCLSLHSLFYSCVYDIRMTVEK